MLLRPATVRQILEAERVDDVRALARRVERNLPTRKGELIDIVDAYLAEPANLEAVVRGLDDVARAAVAEAAHGPGEVRLSAFGAKYGTVVRRTGWLVALFDSGFAMPAELARRLRPLVPRPPRSTLQGLEELPAGPPAAPEGQPARGRRAPAPDALRVRAGAAQAQANLLAVLRLCDGGRLRVSETTRRPTLATVRAVADVLADGDVYADEPIQAFAWPLLLQAGGLVALAAGRLTLSARGRAALAAAPAATLAALWQRWIKGGLIDEFSRVEAIKGQQSRGGRVLTAAAARRAAVAAALADAPPGRWVDVDAFFRHMRAADHDFEVARDPWRLYIGDAQYGSLGYDGSGAWELMQGRYVLCLLFEYAATLGLVDVAYTAPEGARDDFRGNWGADVLAALSRYDGLRYVRLNALGAYALGLSGVAPAPQPDADGRLRVLPNLEVAFLGQRVAAADALLIERYGEARTAGVWALSRAKLLKALERDGSLADLEALLARAENPLPDTVAAFLDDVRGRAGRLRDLGVVRLVECADADLARLLAGDRRLRGLASLVGERCLAVPLAREAAFRRAVREAGYALRQEAAPDAAPTEGDADADAGRDAPRLAPSRRRGRR